MSKSIIPIVPYIEKFIIPVMDINPDGSSPRLYTHQKQILSAAFTPDDRGKLPYRQVVYSCRKKSGKTAVGAMVANWFAFSGIAGKDSEIFCAANDLEQAAGRIFRALKSNVKASKILTSQCEKINEELIALKNGTRIEAISGDYASAAGANPELSLFDELWGFMSESSRRLFEELTPSPARFNSLRVIVTYAGILGESELLEEIYKYCIPDTHIDDFRKREFHDPRFPDLPVYVRGDVFCLHPRSKVRLSNGKSIRISKLYNMGLDNLQVETVDGESLAVGNITNLYKNELGSRYFINVKPNHGRSIYSGTTVTNDHTFKTKRGWVRADELNDKDLVASNTNSPNEMQKELIIGSLLGDGHMLKKNGKSEYYTGLRLTHCKEQKEYFDLKVSALNGLGGKPWIRKSDGALNWESRTSLSLLDLRKQFYPNNIKSIPRNIFNTGISPISLAVWFMDDGSFNGHGGVIYTQSFTDDDVDFLVEQLQGLGIYCRRANYEGHGYKPEIRISADGMRKLGNIIGVFVPNSMRYKIPLDSPQFDSAAWDFGLPYVDYVSVSTKIIHKKTKYVYCIDVDKTHNFISGGLCVHNCYWDHEPRMPWQDEAYYESERNQPGFRDSAYKRIHENRWVESEEGLDMSEWDDCVKLGKSFDYLHWPGPSKNLQLALGVDAATKKDRASVTSCFKKNDMVWLGPRNWWQPDKQNPLQFEQTMEKYILQLHREYSVSVLYYDPWQFERSAQILRQHGIFCQEWPQTQPNQIEVTEYAMDLIRGRKLVMYPDDELRKEATMASLKEIPGRGRRIMKDNENKKIDSLISLTLAAYACGKHCPNSDDLRSQFMLLGRRRAYRAEI